jgi:hypothetical protein
MGSQPLRVFISYSHDSEEHQRGVLALANRLRQDGVEAWLDQYENEQPLEGWPVWMERQIDSADFVLIVCTATYHRRFQGEDDEDRGRGVRWESMLARSILYHAGNDQQKFVPILFEGASDEDVPRILRHHRTHFRLMDDYERLFRVLTDQPRTVPEQLGPLRILSTDVPEAVLDSEAAEEPCEFASSIRAHFSELQQQIANLTSEQHRVIRILRLTKRVRISGCAGSGKTLVAAEKAIRLARAGVRTLFLCHSPHLASYVGELTRGTPVVVWGFAEWVRQIAGVTPEKTLQTWTDYDEPDSTALAEAFDLLTEGSGSFDAVIVDEGQDFRNEWWTVVEASLTDPSSGILYIFHDDHQALLPHRASYPIQEPVIDLSRNCRNAGQIFELVRYFHSQAPEPEVALQGKGYVTQLELEHGREDIAVVKGLTRLADQGLEDSDIVVLLGGGLRLANRHLVDTEVAVRTTERWQSRVVYYFRRALKYYSRKGVTIADRGEETMEQNLTNLSDEPYPTSDDVELVNETARIFTISRDIQKSILDDPKLRMPFRWQVDGRLLRLLRRHPKPITTAEIAIFFASSDWPAGLPKPRRYRLTAEGSRARDRLRVFELNAFKGLEADAIIFLAGAFRPLREQEIYVAISRARFALVIADYGGILPANIVDTLD